MATTTEGCPGAGAGARLSSLHITLPFSVVQVWNDLEVGQVVKLPATDEQDGDMSLHAQRDGSNNISLRFIHKSLAAVADAYAADINIRKVSLSKLDSSSIPVKFPCKPMLPPTIENNNLVKEDPKTTEAPENKQPEQQSATPTQPEQEGPNWGLIGQPRVAVLPSADGQPKEKPLSPDQQMGTHEPSEKQSRMCEDAVRKQDDPGLSKSPVPEPGSLNAPSPASPPQQHGVLNDAAVTSPIPTPVHDVEKQKSALAVGLIPAPVQAEESSPFPVVTQPPVSSTHAAVAPVTFPSTFQTTDIVTTSPNPHPMFLAATTATTPIPTSTLASLTSSVIRPISIAPLMANPTSQALPITVAPITTSTTPPSLSPLKRSYPMDRSQGPVFPGNTNGDMAHGQGMQQEENDEAKKFSDKEDASNGFTPPCKKKRGPRQYKCDICGAEFVYAGVFSKHMWKHNRYSKTSPTPEMPPMMNAAALQQGISRNNMVNILAQQSRTSALPLDMSSQSKLASIPHQAASIGALHLAKSTHTTQVPLNISNTSIDMIKSENGGSYMHCGGGDSGDDMGDDSGLYSDDSLAEVHMEKKDGAGYDCWICGRPFHYRPPFIRHMRGAHEIRVIFDGSRASNKTGKIFTCKLCSQSFLYQLPFEKHMKMIHGASMESVSSKMVDIRDQLDMSREMLRDMPMMPSIPHEILDKDSERSISNIPLKLETKMANDSPSSSPLEKMSMAANSSTLMLKSSLVSPSTVAQTIASSLPSIVSTMCSQSNGPPPSLTDSSVKMPSKDNDYILIDSSGNHIVFGDKLQCFVCSERFTDKRLYLVHMQNEHGIQPKEENSPFKAVGTKTGKVFNCHLCQRRFSYKGPYEKHMRSHGINLVVLEKEVTQESLYCEICGKVFAYQLPYEKHMRNVHNIGTPLKSTAQQMYYRQDYRQTHQCEICFRTFATMQSLVKHVVNKHQTQILGPLSSSDYNQCHKLDSASSHENSMEMLMPENESSSEMEDLPQRVYLNPHSVLKDLSSILPPEDDDEEEAESDLIKLPGKRSEEDLGCELESPDLIPSGEPAEPMLEPARMQDPGSMLSMIKCEICNKMFRYKIAFTKHIEQMHADQYDPNCDQINNNNKIPEDAFDEAQDGDEEKTNGSDQSNMNNSPSFNECDMPVDYSSTRKKPLSEEQLNTTPESMEKEEHSPSVQNAIQEN